MTNLKPTVPVRRLMLAPFAATVAAVLAASAASAAEPTRCAGTMAGTVDTAALVVPEGQTCSIAPHAHVKVSGSVDVKPRATLLMRRGDTGAHGALSVGAGITIQTDASLRSAGTLSVAGGVTATGPRDVRIIESTTIHGDVTIRSWKHDVDLNGIDVHGTLSVQHSDTGRSPAGGLGVTHSRLGALVFTHNHAIVNISHDRIARRLECTPNQYVSGIRFVDNTLGGRPLPGTACDAER
jgi:hypothetical protein